MYETYTKNMANKIPPRRKPAEYISFKANKRCTQGARVVLEKSCISDGAFQHVWQELWRQTETGHICDVSVQCMDGGVYCHAWVWNSTKYALDSPLSLYATNTCQPPETSNGTEEKVYVIDGEALSCAMFKLLLKVVYSVATEEDVKLLCMYDGNGRSGKFKVFFEDVDETSKAMETLQSSIVSTNSHRNSLLFPNRLLRDVIKINSSWEMMTSSLKSKRFCDLTLIANGADIPFVKSLLAASTEYFRVYFTTGALMSGSTNCANLRDFSFNSVQYFLDILLRQEMSIAYLDLKGFLELLGYLQLDGKIHADVIKLIQKKIIKRVNDGKLYGGFPEIIHLLCVAVEFDLVRLAKRLLTCLIKTAENSALKGLENQGSTFGKLLDIVELLDMNWGELKTVREVLMKRLFRITEPDWLDTVIAWLEYNWGERECHTEEALKMVSIECVPHEDIVSLSKEHRHLKPYLDDHLAKHGIKEDGDLEVVLFVAETPRYIGCMDVPCERRRIVGYLPESRQWILMDGYSDVDKCDDEDFESERKRNICEINDDDEEDEDEDEDTFLYISRDHKHWLSGGNVDEAWADIFVADGTIYTKLSHIKYSLDYDSSYACDYKTNEVLLRWEPDTSPLTKVNWRRCDKVERYSFQKNAETEHWCNFYADGRDVYFKMCPWVEGACVEEKLSSLRVKHTPIHELTSAYTVIHCLPHEGNIYIYAKLEESSDPNEPVTPLMRVIILLDVSDYSLKVTAKTTVAPRKAGNYLGGAYKSGNRLAFLDKNTKVVYDIETKDVTLDKNDLVFATPASLSELSFGSPGKPCIHNHSLTHALTQVSTGRYNMQIRTESDTYPPVMSTSGVLTDLHTGASRPLLMPGYSSVCGPAAGVGLVYRLPRTRLKHVTFLASVLWSQLLLQCVVTSGDDDTSSESDIEGNLTSDDESDNLE